MPQVQSTLCELKTEIDNELEKLLSNYPSYGTLKESSAHAVLGGGKRLRPALAIITAEALGVDKKRVVRAASTLELIHAYSMVHDDLPCMDDDDFRRGKPTVHKAFGEGVAVLTGDHLLTYAFEVLATDPFLSPQTKVELITILSQKSGVKGMIGGQVIDIESTGRSLTLEKVQEIHSLKTGALITASVEFGAVIAEACEEERKHLVDFAEKIGLAYQVVDDILDVTASEAKHGTAVSKDAVAEKNTYISILGLEQSKRVARELTESATQSLKKIDKELFPLEELASLLSDRAI